MTAQLHSAPTSAPTFSHRELKAIAEALESESPTTPFEKLLTAGQAVSFTDDPRIVGVVLLAHRTCGWTQYRVRWTEGIEHLNGEINSPEDAWGHYNLDELVVLR